MGSFLVRRVMMMTFDGQAIWNAASGLPLNRGHLTWILLARATSTLHSSSVTIRLPVLFARCEALGRIREAFLPLRMSFQQLATKLPLMLRVCGQQGCPQEYNTESRAQMQISAMGHLFAGRAQRQCRQMCCLT